MTYPKVTFTYYLDSIPFEVTAEIDPGEPMHISAHPENDSPGYDREIISVEMMYAGENVKPVELVDDLLKKYDLELEIWDAWENKKDRDEMEKAFDNMMEGRQ